MSARIACGRFRLPTLRIFDLRDRTCRLAWISCGVSSPPVEPEFGNLPIQPQQRCLPPGMRWRRTPAPGSSYRQFMMRKAPPLRANQHIAFARSPGSQESGRVTIPPAFDTQL
jgi:hypothetical protein